MPMQKVPFQEPAPKEVTEVIIYGDKIDLRTKKYKDSSHIKMYERFNKTEMINTITGEVTTISQKDNKDQREVYKCMKEVNHIVEENLFGTLDKGMLIRAKLNQEMTSQQALLIWKNYKDKILRRLPKGTKWIRILLYDKENIPKYDFWVIAPETITLDEVTIKALWEDGTRTAEVITPVTKKVLEEKAQYYLASQTNMKLYKPREQIIGTSAGIKQARRKTVTHDTAKKQCLRHKRIFESCKRQVETIDNLEQEVQFYTYETYRKEKITVKLKATKDKRYKRKKPTPRATAEDTKEEIKPKKKSLKQMEQEVQETLAEIGLEVQNKLKKGGNQYDTRK